jgi:hypothetical protein
MNVAGKLAAVAQELKQPGPPGQKLFRVLQKGTHSLHLTPSIIIERAVMVETRQPPKPTRALSDLAIRRAGSSDISALAALDNRSVSLLEARLSRGDLIYLGQLDDQVVCATCFHRGPAPFDEERKIFARWDLENDSTFWSYDAMAPMEMRALGVVAKLFEVALKEIFEVHGARQVRGFIYDWNHLSLLLHQRLGFSVIATMTAVGFPGLKWLRWESGGRSRQWVLRRNSDFALPPVAA